MSTRDDFNADVKRALAERAGHRCSFPYCDKVTVGPSDETETSVSRTGMACHIAAAAGGAGARRYVKEMSAEERASIDNGIWMCYEHGKLIDTDERRFTISMLKKWREFAESRARFRQEYGDGKKLPYEKIIEIGLAPEVLSFAGLGTETEDIGWALFGSCVPLVWGDSIGHAVRDVLVEIVRNAFIHGGASICRVTIDKRSIQVIDDGADFSWLGLPVAQGARGGAASVSQLVENFSSNLLLSAKRVGTDNVATIALAHSISDMDIVSPCSVEITHLQLFDIKQGNVFASWFSPEINQCRVIYLVLPNFIPHSDALILADNITPDLVDSKQIVFVVRHASHGVQDFLSWRFPGSRFINLPG